MSLSAVEHVSVSGDGGARRERVAVRGAAWVNDAVSTFELTAEINPGIAAFGLRSLAQGDRGVDGHAVRELRDRLRAGIISAGLQWPEARITVHADTFGRDGRWPASLDLAAAAAVLAASAQVPREQVEGVGFVGELGLDGSIQRSAGGDRAAEVLSWATPVVTDPRTAGCVEDQTQTRAATSLAAMSAALCGTRDWARTEPLAGGVLRWPPGGDPQLGRAATAAAAGGHHLLVVGREASAADDIGAAMAALQQPAGAAGPDTDSADIVAVVHDLGAVAPRTLSELANLMGNPIMSDAAGTDRDPARLVVVGAMAPDQAPRVSPAVRGLSWLPGELLDRFDLRVGTAARDVAGVQVPSLAEARERVAAARSAASERGARRNASLSPHQLAEAAPFTAEGRGLLHDALAAATLSARGMFAVSRVALTLCDIDHEDPVLGGRHVAEALGLRSNVASLSRHRERPQPQRRSTLGR